MWRLVIGRGYYILDSDRQYLYNVRIRYPRVSTDHGIISPELSGCKERQNIRYRKGRSIWPIAAPKRGPMLEEDAGFADL